MPKENDLVLIYLEDKPLSYARIEDILPDSKPDWYHIKLLLLQIPPQIVTWILRDVYIGGDEFTMQGKRMRLEEVVVPKEPQSLDLKEEYKEEKESAKTSENAKIISFSDRKKK